MTVHVGTIGESSVGLKLGLQALALNVHGLPGPNSNMIIFVVKVNVDSLGIEVSNFDSF